MNRFRCIGHVLRKSDGDGINRCFEPEIEGKNRRGRPKMTWRQVLEKDMGEVGLREEDAVDREKWRLLSGKATGQPSGHRGGSAVK